MPGTTLEELLENKRKEIQEHLVEWARAIQILRPGEQIYFEMGLRRIPLVTGAIVHYNSRSRKIPKLPTNTVGENFIKTTYQMDTQDWELLKSLPWTEEWQIRLIKLLHDSNNGPVSKALINQTCRIIYAGPNFTRSINQILKQESNYDAEGKKGYFYRLEPLSRHTIYYALCKTGYF